MARFNRLMGNWDVQIGPIARIPSAIAGTGADYEIPIYALEDLTKSYLMGLPSGVSGDLPNNFSYLRSVILVVEAALAGVATNNFLWQVRQYRAGAIVAQVSLSSASSIAIGANTITLTQASAQYVQVGTVLFISGGTGTAETVVVTAVNQATPSVTFTAVNTHSGAYTMVVQSLILPPYYNGAGVTETALVPHQFATIPNSIKPGDVITLQRLSFGTGLASPAVDVQVSLGGVKNSPAGPMFRG